MHDRSSPVLYSDAAAIPFQSMPASIGITVITCLNMSAQRKKEFLQPNFCPTEKSNKQYFVAEQETVCP